MSSRNFALKRQAIAAAAATLLAMCACFGFAHVDGAHAQEAGQQATPQLVSAQATVEYKVVKAEFLSSYDYEAGMKYAPLRVEYKYLDGSRTSYVTVDDLENPDKSISAWGPQMKVSLSGASVTVRGVENCKGSVTLKCKKAKPKPPANVFRPWKKGSAGESSFKNYYGDAPVYTKVVKKVKASKLAKGSVTVKLPTPVNKASLKWSYSRAGLNGEFHQEYDNFDANVKLNKKKGTVTIKKGAYKKKTYYLPIGMSVKESAKYQAAYYGPGVHPMDSNYLFTITLK